MENQITKQCSRCKESKSITKFGSNKRTNDGHHFYCKTCHNSIHNDLYYTIKEQHNELNKTYCKKRYSTDPLYKLRKQLNSRFYHFVNGKQDQYIQYLLGWTHEQLLNFIENNRGDLVKFEKGMDPKTTYDIDHIFPLGKAISENELLQLYHHTNLQIISSFENRYIKRDKINI